MTRTQETKIVKDALRAAGLPIRKVVHGHGTGSSWIHIYVDTYADERHYNDQIIQIVQQVTGRRGSYDGHILVSA